MLTQNAVRRQNRERQPAQQQRRLEESNQVGHNRRPVEINRSQQIPAPAERIGDEWNRVRAVDEDERKTERDPTDQAHRHERVRDINPQFLERRFGFAIRGRAGEALPNPDRAKIETRNENQVRAQE